MEKDIKKSIVTPLFPTDKAVKISSRFLIFSFPSFYPSFFRPSFLLSFLTFFSLFSFFFQAFYFFPFISLLFSFLHTSLGVHFSQMTPMIF